MTTTQPTIQSLFKKANPPLPDTKPARSALNDPKPAAKKPENLVSKKPEKTEKTAKTQKTERVSKNLLGERLRYVGAAQLEKKILALRTRHPHARIVVFSLCWRLQCGSADAYKVMNESNHTAYDTFKTQTVLGFYEFVGLACEGGVGAAIAEALSEDERTHVIVVDATPKAEFARLAACFGAVVLKLSTGRVVKVSPPINPLLAEAVAVATNSSSTFTLHSKMETYYDAKMAYVLEPEHEEKPRKKAKKKP